MYLRYFGYYSPNRKRVLKLTYNLNLNTLYILIIWKSYQKTFPTKFFACFWHHQFTYNTMTNTMKNSKNLKFGVKLVSKRLNSLPLHLIFPEFMRLPVHSYLSSVFIVGNINRLFYNPISFTDKPIFSLLSNMAVVAPFYNSL